jgi:cell division septum initiation protein DivIVA
MDRLDRKDVKNTAFDVVLRGYDKRQVDERFRFLCSELTAAENALQAATQRAAMLEDALNEARSASGGEPPGQKDQMSLPDFGARIEKILTLAQDEAREVRAQADAAAAALVEQARAEADQIRQAVTAEVGQIRQAVTVETDELFSAAAADAEKVSKAAHSKAEQLLAQARAEAERLVTVATDTAQRRERSSAHELHQLSRLHDEINADLYRAKEVLDGLFGVTRGISGTTTEIIQPNQRMDGVQPPYQARTV